MQLRAFRKKLGLTQAEAAEQAGLSAPAFYQAEMGATVPSPDSLLKIMAWSINPKTGKPRVTERDFYVAWCTAQGKTYPGA